MNHFLNYIAIVAVLCLLQLPYGCADDDDDLVLVAVRTYLVSPTPIPATLMTQIDTGMDSISDDDDRRKLMDNKDPAQDSKTRHNLRANGESETHQRELTCSYCRGYPRYYKGCWVKYTWTPRCGVRRQLIVQAEGNDEEIAKLNDQEQRRYLQLSTECAQAIADRDDDIDDAVVNGIVPQLPTNASFIEECIFEEIPDDDEDDDED